MYRTLDGRLSSGSRDVHVVMITTPGRRTGIPRSARVRYLEMLAGLVVWGLAPAHGQTPTGAEQPYRARRQRSINFCMASG